MAQSIVKRGSVVLIRYPFTDLTGAKVRPALVVTPDHLLPRLGDVLCLFISSAMPDDLLPTDFVLEPRHPSFPTTGLKRRSVLRMHKLASLRKVSCYVFWAREISLSCMKSINGCVWRWACNDMARKPKIYVGVSIPWEPNKGLQPTANRVRSCLAPAIRRA